MSSLNAHNRVLLVAVVSGALLAWAGGFILSSKNSRCVDDPGFHDCSGTFASDAWHGVGLASVMAGLIVVMCARGIAAFARWRSRSNEH